MNEVIKAPSCSTATSEMKASMTSFSPLNAFAILLLLIPVATPLSFNFSTFTTSNNDIIYDGSAQLSNSSILLTTNVGPSIGHATYSQPLHLYDNSSSSRNLTDFTTNFSFVVNSAGSTNYGDGFVFFLVPDGSRLPGNATAFGFGLTTTPLTSEVNHFVAVEFDILSTEGVDPPNEHVGIDINSVRSVTNVTWWTADSIVEGREQEAWISYDSQSMNLNVVFTGFRNRAPITQRLSYVVDLREHLPEFVNFGFSGATGGSAAFQSISSWSFSSSFEKINYDSSFVGSGKSHTKQVKRLLGGVVAAVLLVVLLFLFWKYRQGIMSIFWKKRESTGVEIEMPFKEEESVPKKFTYNELKEATDNFSVHNKLGEGGFGDVYRGFLKKYHLEVAVKKISESSKQGIREYESEVKIISRLRHKHLVELYGWCHEKKRLLLVYDLMPKGSLDYHLFGKTPVLSWETRFKIAQGLASALLYLHEECKRWVVHRDIKSSNVMLDDNFDAKLGDFGLARLVDHEREAPTTTKMLGTHGYIAPEYMNTQKASKETDVYSFGVVALEIACGRRPICPQAEESQVNLVKWVWSLHGTNRILDSADPALRNKFNSKQMKQLMIVGLSCAHPDRLSRPTIRRAALALNFEAELPDLPLTMPVNVVPGSGYDVSGDYFTSEGATSTSTSGSGNQITNDYFTSEWVAH